MVNVTGAYDAIFDKEHPIVVAFLGRSFSPYQIAQLARQQPERYMQEDEATQRVAATAEAARAVEQDLLAEDSEGNAHVDTTAFISLNTMDTEGLQVKTKQVGQVALFRDSLHRL